MFWFGDIIEDDAIWRADAGWRALASKRRALSLTKIQSIINLLDAFSEKWKPGSHVFERAIPDLIHESGFSEIEARKTLALLVGILKKESLERRIKAEFNRADVLDGFVKLPDQMAKVYAAPVGIILHVTAGNIFLSSIDSLLMGFLTKNLSVLKVSSQNKFFPQFFAEELKRFDKENLLADKFSVLHWKGGDEKTEAFIKTKVNIIMAWGGEEMISSYQKNLPSHIKLLDFGPKISMQIISKNGLENKNLKMVAEKVVADITPWDQAACASPQNLYIQEGIDSEKLILEIDEAFKASTPRGAITEDEATEILKEIYRGYYSELMEGGKIVIGKEHIIHKEKSNILKPSPLNRSLIIKTYKDSVELAEILQPFSFYLQSCAYLLGDEEKNHYLSLLSATGLKRFAPLGTITWGMEGTPHDGQFVLRRLVDYIVDEHRVQDYGEDITKVHNAATLKTHFNNTSHPSGYIFSSGGTTGEPKFVHFSYEEFDYMSDMLAINLRKQGIHSGMTIANLFVAGNLWSSFMCVERALEKIGAIQLPIGGMCSSENILMYLKKFKPDVVMGIPSMLVMNAELSAQKGDSLHIPTIFYAGEALSECRKEYLEKTWGTTDFGSAGYASVDAGVIGYQCKECGPGEHHIFSDLIQLSIIEDEAVVTSLARSTMPIKNYRTGDKIEWISDCACGSHDRRFKLLGRADNVIQIWSCRLLTTDVEEAMTEFRVMTYQLTITESREANLVREKLTISFESTNQEIESDDLLRTIYDLSRDVKDTITFTEFKKDIILNVVGKGDIPRNLRTGKISVVLDKRC